MRPLSRSTAGFAVGVLWLACCAADGAAKPPCESARVLKIRTQVLSEAQVVRPQPPASDDAPRAAQGQPAAIYDIFLECAGKTYVARVTGSTQTFDPGLVGTKLTLRTSPEGKVLARGEDGAEFEVTLAPVSKP